MGLSKYRKISNIVERERFDATPQIVNIELDYSSLLLAKIIVMVP